LSKLQNKINLNQPHDYLKYWRVIRYFVKRKYGLSQSDLDVILFLYREDRFSKDKFVEFDRLLSWDKDRFKRLRKEEWITVFRKRMGKRKALYELSYKGKRVANSIYKKLSGEEIPETRNSNPMYAKNVGFADKVYRNMITEMNAATRQRRHQAPESE
tara:strand:- start:2224 stop:2697 length:474 start_codon:yes stop_codon:yes gene_type:complete